MQETALPLTCDLSEHRLTSKATLILSQMQGLLWFAITQEFPHIICRFGTGNKCNPLAKQNNNVLHLYNAAYKLIYIKYRFMFIQILFDTSAFNYEPYLKKAFNHFHVNSYFWKSINQIGPQNI